MRIASLNLRFAFSAEEHAQAVREPRIYGFMRDTLPNSVGVQECEWFWYDRLNKTVGELGYASVQEPAYDHSKTSEELHEKGNSNYAFKNYIYYNTNSTRLIEGGKFWLSETPNVPSKGFGSRFYISAAWALLEIKESGERYVHINTHLNVDKSEIRNAEVKVILAKAREFEEQGLRVFITGDFNDRMESECYASVAASYTDAREAAKIKPALDYTYNNYWADDVQPNPEKRSLIDFCFFKGEKISVETFDVVDKWSGGYMSDHNALLVDIKL